MVLVTYPKAIRLGLRHQALGLSSLGLFHRGPKALLGKSLGLQAWGFVMWGSRSRAVSWFCCGGIFSTFAAVLEPGGVAHPALRSESWGSCFRPLKASEMTYVCLCLYIYLCLSLSLSLSLYIYIYICVCVSIYF